MKTIRQTVIFKANRHEVYEVLMDAKKHSTLTGSDVKLTRRIGDKFTVYGGDIEGVNLELVLDRKIVQSWRYSDWPKGHYSRVTFSLEDVKDGTRLTFTQEHIPDEHYEEIKQGWRDYYWTPLKEMLKKSK